MSKGHQGASLVGCVRPRVKYGMLQPDSTDLRLLIGAHVTLVKRYRNVL